MEFIDLPPLVSARGTVRSSSVYLTEAGGMGTVQQIDLTV